MNEIIEGLRHLVLNLADCGLYRLTTEEITNGLGELMNHKATIACYKGDRDFNVSIYLYPEDRKAIVNTGIPLRGQRFANPVEETLANQGIIDIDGNPWETVLV